MTSSLSNVRGAGRHLRADRGNVAENQDSETRANQSSHEASLILRPAFDPFRDRLGGDVRDIEHRADRGPNGLDHLEQHRPARRWRTTLR